MSGNGTDMGHIVAMVQQLIVTVDALGRKLDAEIGALRQDVGTLKQDVGTLKQDVGSLKQEVSSLRSDVNNYHNSVFGHGILMSELDERVTASKTMSSCRLVRNTPENKAEQPTQES